MARVHAFGDDALGDDDAVQIADRVRRGDVSPQELRTAATARLDLVDPAIRGLREDRRHAPMMGKKDGALAGVPTVIKENTEVAGWPTVNGTEAHRPRPATSHSGVTRQVLAAGLDVLGTSRMPEFGLNATTEFAAAPPTRNPWNLAYSSGGSSGGAAALVAAGVVPIAHGNDGGGSIRVPAAACGLVGLKPSRGRTAASANGQRMPIDIQSDGVLTRTVRDTAAFLAATDRHRPDASLPPLGLVEGPAERRLRIGLVLDVGDHPSDGVAVDPDSRRAVEDTARGLEVLGHDVTPARTPVDGRFLADFLDYWCMLAFGVVAGGRVLYGSSFRSADLDPFTRTLATRYRRRLSRTPAFLRRLAHAGRRYGAAFRDHDVLLTPVTGYTVPRLGWLGPELPPETVLPRLVRYAAFTPLANIAGTPAIALPAAVTSDGLPIGVQVSAARGDERTLLELAYTLEATTSWPRIDR